MDWLWPDLLLLLGSVPLLVVIYVGMLRRRYRFAARYSSLSLVREAITTSRLRRHFPFLLFLVAFASLILAMGRPVTPVNVLAGRTTILLALDTSRSMCMRDILPSRLDAAKSAALWFVRRPVPGTQVGVVAFAGFAELAQRPTTRVSRLETSIQNLTTATRTAIGSAILTSLDAIAKVDHRVAPSSEAVVTPGQLKSLTGEEEYVPHVIVLLTDGASNTGPSPLGAAQQAAERGVRIYTIGFGTTSNVVMDCWGGDPLGSPGLEPPPASGGFGSAFDESTLRQIAEITGGEFYSATSAAELQMVFQNLHKYIALNNETTEVSVYFAGLGVLMVVAAFFLAFVWRPVL